MRSVFGIVGLVFVLLGLAFGQASNCPKITVDGPSSHWTRPGQEIIFTVSVGREDISGLKYKWTLSDGNVIKGRDTDVIYIDTTGVKDKDLFATVEIAGLPDKCPNAVTAKQFVGNLNVDLEVFDEFKGLSKRDEKVHFDHLGLRMKDDPNTIAYIIEYYPKRTTDGAISKKKERLIIYLRTRWTIDSKRLVFIRATADGKTKTRFYLVPTDSSYIPEP